MYSLTIMAIIVITFAMKTICKPGDKVKTNILLAIASF